MTRRLLLMRHAKNDWSRPLSDHDRVLNARGCADAAAMGRRLAAMGWVPQLALVSSAARTQETFTLLEDAVGQSVDTVRCDDLYLPSAQAVAARIASVEPEVGCLLVLSHNPTCEDLATAWASRWVGMRTACIAVFETASTWSEAMSDPGSHLRWLTRLSPKDA